LTTAILLRISAQLANSSSPAYQVDDFEIPHYAIVVNALFFTSLCCSIIAALASVIALQWVNGYDGDLDNVDPRKYALIRHLRFLGVEKWKMGEIIALLPILLHGSVFLFFAGIIEWMGNRNRTICYICIGGAAVAVIFYLLTTTLRALFGMVPFRTPIAKFLRVIFLYSTFGIWATLVASTTGIIFLLHLITSWVMISLGQFRRVRDQSDRVWRLVMEVILPASQKLMMGPLHRMGFSEEVAIQDPSLELELATWTATHVGISQQSLHRLVHILGHSYSLIAEDKVLHGRWEKALNQIAESYLKGLASREPSEADAPSLRIFVNIWVTFKPHFWSSSMIRETKYQSWSSWDSIVKLVGPLDHEGPLQEFEIVIIVKLIQLNNFKMGPQSLDTLQELSSAFLDHDNPPSPSIVRYAVSILSIYLWTHDNCALRNIIVDILVNMIKIPNHRRTGPLLGEIEMSLYISHRTRRRRVTSPCFFAQSY
jgi:hypothetical protein